MIPCDPTPQAGFALLNEMSDSEIAWLLAEGEPKYFERDAVLVQEGSRIETLYIVLRGVFKVTIGGAGGREIAKLGPGQIVGEMSFLEDRPASATVRALEGSEVLGLPRAAIGAKLRQDAVFSAHLFRGLAIVTSRRLRNVVGQLGRWLETEPIAEPEVLALWNEVARLTQEFKARVVAAGKADIEGTDGSDLADSLRDFAAALNRAIGDQSSESVNTREELGARVQRELLPYFLKAKTPAQIYGMPRGYPGDFQTFEMICAEKPDGEPPLGPLLDRAFLGLPVMAAFRSGRDLLQTELRRVAETSKAKSLHITAVASAPAPELRGVVAAGKSSRAQATLIEFDDEALARMRTAHRSSGLRFESESLVNLALGQRRVGDDGQDFAYSLLASSFSDRFAVGLINYLHSLLRPGGWACVGCVHPRNPDRAFLEHVLGWNIVHRDEGEMHTLFRHSAFGSACDRFEAEESGIFYLAACQKA